MDLQRWNKSRLGHRPLTVEAFALHRPECLRSPAAPPLHPRTSPCGPEVRSHRRKAVHICCAFHWTTLIEMLSLWRAPRAHLPGSINLWDCGPAPGSNGEAEWTPCCPYDQGLVIEPLGVFRGSFCVGWRYPADNRPLTPCPKCCSCWLSKHPLTDTVWSRLPTCFVTASSFQISKHATSTPTSGPLHLFFPLPGSSFPCSPQLVPHLSGLSSEVTSERPSLTTLVRAIAVSSLCAFILVLSTVCSDLIICVYLFIAHLLPVECEPCEGRRIGSVFFILLSPMTSTVPGT